MEPGELPADLTVAHADRVDVVVDDAPSRAPADVAARECEWSGEGGRRACGDRASGDRAFQWLLAPVSPARFYEQWWERRVGLVLRPLSREYYAGWFGRADVDKLLRAGVLRYGTNIDVVRYSAVHGGARETLNGEGVADAERVWALFESGCSLRVLHPQRWSDHLWLLLGALEHHWQGNVGCNVYVTPPASQGFSPHYDDIDAFVLQVEGCKRWRCYQGVKRHPGDDDDSAGGEDGEGEGEAAGEEGLLPRFSSGDFVQQELVEPPILDVVLRPGDLLYMPRGVIHQAEAVDDQHSLHLTISASQRNTMADFLHLALPRAIEVAAEEHVVLRHSLPRDLFDFMGVMHAPPLPDTHPHPLTNADSGTSLKAAPAAASEAGGDPRRAAFLQRVQQAVQLVAACGPWDSAADQMASAFLRSRLPPFRASQLSASAPSAAQSAMEGGGGGGGKGGGGAAGKRRGGKVQRKSRVRVSVEGGCRLVVEDGVAVVYHMMDNRREVHNQGEDSGVEQGEEQGEVEEEKDDGEETRMSRGAEEGATTTDQGQVNPGGSAMCVEDKEEGEEEDEDEDEEEGLRGEGRLEFELQWAELLEELVQLNDSTVLGPLLKRLAADWEGPAAAATAAMLSVVQELVDHGFRRTILVLPCLLLALSLCATAPLATTSQSTRSRAPSPVATWRAVREVLPPAGGRWQAPWMGGGGGGSAAVHGLGHRALREGIERQSALYHADASHRARRRLLAAHAPAAAAVASAVPGGGSPARRRLGGGGSSSKGAEKAEKSGSAKDVGKSARDPSSSNGGGAGAKGAGSSALLVPAGAGNGTSIVPYGMWGLALPTGSYYLNVTVGTPGQEVAVVMDTGSSLMWLPCDCIDCAADDSLAAAAYDSSKSPNSSVVPCSSPLCLADYTFGCNRFNAPAPPPAASPGLLGGLLGGGAAEGSAGEGGAEGADGECEFVYSYADNSSTSGRVMIDTLDLPTVADGMVKDKMLFGCGQYQAGNLAKSSYIYGLMGMGVGPISPLTQLYTAGHVPFAFAFCFDSANDTGSHLVLGRSPGPPALRSTTLLPSQRPFYFIDVVRMTVDGATLPGSENLAPTNATQGTGGAGVSGGAGDTERGGVIVDSGTTLTILPSDLYASVLQTVFAGQEVFFVPELNLDCIVLGFFDGALPAFPVIHMEMADGAVWSISSSNYLSRFDDGFDQYYCATMMAAPDNFPVSVIIGETWVLDTYIAIDIEKKQLGWAPLNCSSGEYLTFNYTRDPFADMTYLQPPPPTATTAPPSSDSFLPAWANPLTSATPAPPSNDSSNSSPHARAVSLVGYVLKVHFSSA
ncbi:unnamed protein product [Closterium sp. Yama58-4]|nr:unnamed protein product [Closterium sp. Yama58-4]